MKNTFNFNALLLLVLVAVVTANSLKKIRSTEDKAVNKLPRAQDSHMKTLAKKGSNEEVEDQNMADGVAKQKIDETALAKKSIQKHIGAQDLSKDLKSRHAEEKAPARRSNTAIELNQLVGNMGKKAEYANIVNEVEKKIVEGDIIRQLGGTHKRSVHRAAHPSQVKGNHVRQSKLFRRRRQDDDDNDAAEKKLEKALVGEKQIEDYETETNREAAHAQLKAVNNLGLGGNIDQKKSAHDDAKDVNVAEKTVRAAKKEIFGNVHQYAAEAKQAQANLGENINQKKSAHDDAKDVNVAEKTVSAAKKEILGNVHPYAAEAKPGQAKADGGNRGAGLSKLDDLAQTVRKQAESTEELVDENGEKIAKIEIRLGSEKNPAGEVVARIPERESVMQQLDDGKLRPVVAKEHY